MKKLEDDEMIIFRPYIIHPVSGKKIFPKNGKVFPIIVKKD